MSVHHFTPSLYHLCLGAFDPVFQVASGDTIVTTTVDAGGQDQRGEIVAGRGNPQTGPFFVQGAEPGDTLAVRLDRLRPNRSWGWVRSRLASNVVDPEAVLQFPESPRGRWELDLEAGTVTLVEPVTSLGRWTLPLAPMVGCFGVAPAGTQAISAATSGPHGGNMDYRGFCEGATVYFPVEHRGALFFIGDGHALQADGEILGTGIETSFEVEFTVLVQKGRKIGWPRFENETHLGAAGNARPLDQALQHATTEMLGWLMEEYRLEATAAHLLLGHCIEYEIANVFDPAYTVVAKIPRSVLPTSVGPRFE